MTHLLHSAQDKAALRRRCFGDIIAGDEDSRGDWKEDIMDKDDEERERTCPERRQGRAQEDALYGDEKTSDFELAEGW